MVPAALRQWAGVTGCAALSPRARAVRSVAAWRTWVRWSAWRVALDARCVNASWCLTFCAIKRGFGAWTRLVDDARILAISARAASLQHVHSTLCRWRRAGQTSQSFNTVMGRAVLAGAEVAGRAAFRRLRVFIVEDASQRAKLATAERTISRQRLVRGFAGCLANRRNEAALAARGSVVQLYRLASASRAALDSWRMAADDEIQLREVAAVCAANHSRRAARAVWAALMTWSGAIRQVATLDATESLAVGALARQRRRGAVVVWSEQSASFVRMERLQARAMYASTGSTCLRAMRAWATEAVTERSHAACVQHAVRRITLVALRRARCPC